MIVHANITEQIISYMKNKIAEGEWAVGEKIPSENQLSKELGVSRASIRDAIKFYTGQGMMETFHGKGTFLVDNRVDESARVSNIITQEDCEDVRDVLEFRRTIESEACALAAERIDEDTLSLLRYCLRQMEEKRTEKNAYLDADMEFHRLVANASGNMLFMKSLNHVISESKKAFSQMYDLFGYRNGLGAHQKILKALEERDIKAARRAMYEHMQGSLEKLKTKEIIS